MNDNEIEVLTNFYNNMVKEQQNIDPMIAEIINDHFWELVC